MKQRILPLVFLSLLFVHCQFLAAQVDSYKNIKWHRDKIAKGMIWKSSHTGFPGPDPQNINVLIVNTHKRKIGISYNSEKNITVSVQADSSDAIAAVNGGFFNIKEGGSVTYIRTNFKITDADTAKSWKRNVNLDGAILIDAKGTILIEKAHTNQWFDENLEYKDVLVTGPLLLRIKEEAALPETSLVTLRHPRTAFGIKGKHKAILVTVDGRTESAAGMTLNELTDLMGALGCRDAINLDGGGSTTMWIRNKPYDGVVNMPCDNKKFDHEGSRAVSNIVIVR